MTTTTARYSGDCETCPEPIEPGDEIVALADGTFVHVLCDAQLDLADNEEEVVFCKPRKQRKSKPVEVCDDCHYTNPCFCV